MPIRLFELAAGGAEEEKEKKGHSIVSGIVVFNCDLLKQGKVMVRIPALGRTLWARLTAPGAGPNAGMLYVPRPDDEVLVAFNQADPSDSFIINSLWNTRDQPPADGVPLELMTKRVFRTGVTAAAGHEVEFDDVRQSITITSSTQQKITIDPLKIELSNLAGTVKITMDNTKQAITIWAANSIELKALKSIKLQAAQVDIEGTMGINVKSIGPCNITGLPVKIN